MWEELCKFSLKKQLSKGKQKTGIIFNTDPHYKEGSHWISLFINIQNNKGYGYGILSGLKEANGDILSWTHADLQTDLLDVLKGLSIFENSSNPELLFVKGQRHGRPFLDVFLTVFS